MSQVEQKSNLFTGRHWTCTQNSYLLIILCSAFASCARL
jgi:hypothetical protein